MKIARVEGSIHRVRVTPPLMARDSADWTFVLCRVETECGIVGYGLTGRILAKAIEVSLNGEIAQTVKGMDPRAVEAVHHRIWQTLNQRTQTGVIIHATAALDIALWDIAGKSCNRTIAALLGGYSDSAPVYCTFGLKEYDRDQLADAARHFVGQGYTGLKMVVGTSPGRWREDVARIRNVREAIGDGVDLMIDANYKLDPFEARCLAQAVEELDIRFFEEPLHQNDARALADLRRLTRVPIAAGQMEGHRWRYRELVDHRAVDVLQPNVCYAGGFTEARKVAHLAQIYNLPITIGGGWPHINVHLMAGLMNGGMVEVHQVTGPVLEALFPELPKSDGRHIRVPEAPGLGAEPDLHLLSDTRITL